MEYISFVTDLLNKIGLSSHIVNDTNFQKIDKGIRGLFFNNENYVSFLSHTLHEIKDRTIYRYMDEYRCCYIAMRISDNKYFFIGPYLTEFPDIEFIKNKSLNSNLSEKKMPLIINYYSSLPLFKDEKAIIAIANTFGKYIWNSENNFEFEYIDDIYFDQIEPSHYSDIYDENSGSLFNIRLIEARYNYEKVMMEAVSTGKINDVSFISSLIFNENIRNKNFDSSLHLMNHLIVINTLLRKAAEDGGLHPYYINCLSTEFSKNIGLIKTSEECFALQNKMITEYCLLVRKNSQKRYSSLISKVMAIIDYDITADLSLKTISGQLFVNSSYLSGCFSKEIGMTLTEYVNKKRIDSAVVLIHKTDMQIQDIASQVGISDINYFIRLFKKKYNMTPTAYRKHIGK